MSNNNLATTPICPRCGYDLTGAIGTWTDSCPVRGRCTECGHEFSWGVIMHPELADIPNFVEHANSKYSFLWWSIRTSFWLIFPLVFWRRVTINRRIHLAILLLLIPFWTIGLHILTSMVLCVHHYVAVEADILFWWRELWMLQDRTHDTVNYATLWLLPFGSLWRGATLFGAASFRPLAEWPALVMVPLYLHISWVIMVAVLSDSRKMAKLRLVHVLRGLVYGLAWLPALAFLRLAFYVMSLASAVLLDDLPRPPFYEFVDGPLMWLLPILLGWLCLFWWDAIRAWRIPQPLLVYWILFPVTALGCVTLSMFFHGPR